MFLVEPASYRPGISQWQRSKARRDSGRGEYGGPHGRAINQCIAPFKDAQLEHMEHSFIGSSSSIFFPNNVI